MGALVERFEVLRPRPSLRRDHPMGQTCDGFAQRRAARAEVEADLMEAESCRDKWSIRKDMEKWRNDDNGLLLASLLLLVRHLFTTSDALVPSSFLPA